MTHEPTTTDVTATGKSSTANAEIFAPKNEMLLSELNELARAMRIAVPQLRDHGSMAVVIRNILRARGIELVRLP